MRNAMHPLTELFIFAFVIFGTAFLTNPVIIATAGVFGILFYCLLGKRVTLRGFFATLLAFFVLSLINPLFTHRGETVLFYLGGKSITLEALFYGFYIAAMILVTLLWCYLLKEVLSMDRITAALGSVFPKSALVFCMILRFIPLYRRKYIEFRDTQKLLGIYGDGSLPDRVKGTMQIFSAVLTWALEHSMETADSMRQRKYGTHKRRAYHEYRYKISDVILTVLLITATAYLVYTARTGNIGTVFYPRYRLPDYGIKESIAFLMYGLLAGLLPALKGKEELTWKRLKQKI